MKIQYKPEEWSPGFWAGTEGRTFKVFGTKYTITHVDLRNRIITAEEVIKSKKRKLFVFSEGRNKVKFEAWSKEEAIEIFNTQYAPTLASIGFSPDKFIIRELPIKKKEEYEP